MKRDPTDLLTWRLMPGAAGARGMESEVPEGGWNEILSSLKTLLETGMLLRD